MQVDCPKCGSGSARYVADGFDVVLRCLCGYHKVVATRLENMEIEHRETGRAVVLPKQGTKIWNCLMALVALKEASTIDICRSVNSFVAEEQNISEVSSQLTVLRYKGLVEVIDNRKGMAGGSTWRLTSQAKELTI